MNFLQDFAHFAVFAFAKDAEQQGMIPQGTAIKVLTEAPKKVKQNPLIKQLLPAKQAKQKKPKVTYSEAPKTKQTECFTRTKPKSELPIIEAEFEMVS